MECHIYLFACMFYLQIYKHIWITMCHQVSSKFNFVSHTSTLFEMKTRHFISFLKYNLSYKNKWTQNM
jgi:hypothetical protein